MNECYSLKTIRAPFGTTSKYGDSKEDTKSIISFTYSYVVKDIIIGDKERKPTINRYLNPDLVNIIYEEDEQKNYVYYYNDDELIDFYFISNDENVPFPDFENIINKENDLMEETLIGFDLNNDGIVDDIPVRISSDLTLRAVKDTKRFQYEVIFKSDDNIISRQVYNLNDEIIAPSNPLKRSSCEYDYVFKEWLNYTEGMIVNSDMTFIASYEKVDKIYTYRFFDNLGNLICEKKAHYGETIIPPVPENTENVVYTYTFISWNKDIPTKVVEDMDFTGIYSKEIKTYTYKFTDEEGNVLKEETIPCSETFSPPLSPYKEADESKTYTFAFWNGYVEGMTIINDQVFTPEYSYTYIYYTITFLNEGKVINETTYKYGEKIIFPSTPNKEEDKIYYYVFESWDNQEKRVTNNRTFNAVFTPIFKDYTVEFVNEDGTVLQTKEYHYGDDVMPPNTPSKKADETYTYEFKEWDKEITSVSQNTVYKALYTPSYIDYLIEFVNYDGSIILSSTYHYNEWPVTPEDPQRMSNEMHIYTYVFSGWNEPIIRVNGSKTYEAVYKKIPVIYEVTFMNGNYVHKKTSYYYNDEIIPPSNPSKTSDKIGSYTFLSWEGYKEGMLVTGNMTFKANYKIHYNTYTIKFYSIENGLLSEKKDYHYGDVIIIPKMIPTKTADEKYTYEFSRWIGYE